MLFQAAITLFAYSFIVCVQHLDKPKGIPADASAINVSQFSGTLSAPPTSYGIAHRLSSLPKVALSHGLNLTEVCIHPDGFFVTAVIMIIYAFLQAPFIRYLINTLRTKPSCQHQKLDVVFFNQAIKSLQDLAQPISQDAPMRVVRFTDFQKHGKLPRSNERMTVDVSDLYGDSKLIFISHRWIRPWKTREECEGNAHAWAGMPHPDYASGTKHALICAATKKLAEKKNWDVTNVYLWLDFFSVDQDDARLLQAAAASLRAYVSVCDAVIIPAPGIPTERDRTVDRISGDYGIRAWIQLECMAFYTVGYVCVCARNTKYTSLVYCMCMFYIGLCHKLCVCVCVSVCMRVT